MTPLLTILTPTFRRPQALAACLRSVGMQTARDQVEHLVLPDHVGTGIPGMFAKLAQYTAAVHGRYVAVVGDDDVLDAPDVIARLQQAIDAANDPPLVLAPVHKGSLFVRGEWPPVCGAIDLANLIVRADVWRAYAGAYGARYEGDFDFSLALWSAGYPALHVPVLFARGPMGRGHAEEAA